MVGKAVDEVHPEKEKGGGGENSRGGGRRRKLQERVALVSYSRARSITYNHTVGSGVSSLFFSVGIS